MKRISLLIIMVLAVQVTACTGFNSHTEVEALNEVEAVGSPFTRNLAEGYREFSTREQDVMMDYPDAIHFARKGLAAASGEIVLPEALSDWNVEMDDLNDLATGRSRLISAFDLGAREIAPQISARAQVKFDCWIEQEEENWQSEDIRSCRQEFISALEQLEQRMAQYRPEPTPEPVPEPQTETMAPVTAIPMDPGQELAAEDAVYLVFFDFDKATIGPGGANVLDAVADEIKSRSLNKVEIIGHTDTSGPKDYNMRLSQRRARAVREALIDRDISASLISIKHKGEQDLLVETADGVREPANRRATISFE